MSMRKLQKLLSHIMAQYQDSKYNKGIQTDEACPPRH
jgi:hypothetical protein